MPISTNGLPLHAARGAAVVAVSRPVRMRHHGTPRTICGIEGCAAPAGSLNCTPSSLASEDGVVEAIERAWTGAVDKRSMAHERDVVETEVPDGGIGHAVGAESHQSADDRSGEDIVPVVVLVDSKSTSDQASSKNGCVESDELPHSRVMVGKDLQLGVEVQVQVDETSERSRGVAGRHRLKTVVDLFPVTCADATVEHDLTVPICDVAIGATGFDTVVVGADSVKDVGRDDRLADGKEVRTKTSNEPLDEDLENSRGDQSVEKSDGSIVQVPEAASADLHDQEHGKGDEERHERGSPNGNNFVPHGVSELRVDNLSILEDDGEAAARGWISEVYTETDSAHEGHGKDVEPGSLDP